MPAPNHHLILFADSNCSGAHKHVFESKSFLSDFNDVVSSFVILSGQWQFFVDANFVGQVPATGPTSIGPGVYNSVTAVLGTNTNDRISSVRAV
jgi:Beta/Gamma crystallin